MVCNPCGFKGMKTLLVGVLLTLASASKAEWDALVFSDVMASHVDGEHFSEKNVKPSIDLFVSGKKGPLLVLMEGFASEKAQHMERFQLGLNVTDSSRFWLGRHHTPFGYWHTQYHHGTYLQTSASRPALVELGGAGGILPSHTTGGLFEVEVESQEAAWHYAVSLGYSSQLSTSGGGHHGGGAISLNDFDLLNPKAGDHDMSAAFRLAYLPSALEETQLGAFWMQTDITLNESARDDLGVMPNQHISLDIAGVFANVDWSAVRLIGEWYYLETEVPEQSIIHRSQFSAAYLQLEYSHNERWTPYIRFDHTSGDEGDPYLHLLKAYPRSGQALGVRYDIASRHAFKLEYTYREFEHSDSGRWLLSWSTAWP